jgi:ADP-ribosylglycohydrolase
MDPSHAIGSILGTAVGDAIGLPYENLSPQRALRLLGPPDRHRLFLGRGMVSDDCEHACMTASALARSGGEPNLFAAELARQLRWWILALPAGTGLATARAAFRLWLGIRPDRSGVRSAGNGPAMRTTILGATVEDPARLRELVVASSPLTHTDARAFEGALIVALASRLATQEGNITPSRFRSTLQKWCVPSDLRFAEFLEAAFASVEAGEPIERFAARHGMERGVSGFIVQTVPIAVHAWLSSPADLRAPVRACIRCGGDTDTTAAIAGGIVGAGVGPKGIPSDWLAHLWAQPRSVKWMEQLAIAASSAAAASEPGPVPAFPWALVPVRNLGFLAIVLAHGLRRLGPPY